MSTALWLGRVLGLGFVIAALPLALTHFRHATAGGAYELGSIHLAVWWTLLSVAAAAVATGRPRAALASAGNLELGFMIAFVLDVAYSLSVGIPHTIWPIAIVLVLVLTSPAVALGALVGYMVGKWRSRASPSASRT